MERRKPGGSDDDLVIVKAAAWAWFERGSGSHENPVPEYGLSRPFRAPKSSRFKLESLKGSQYLTSPLLSRSDTNISLLDRYDIDRISSQLDHYTDSSRFLFEGDLSPRRVVALPESDVGGVKKNKKKKGRTKGLWFWPRHGVVCGSSDDVVETSVLVVGGGGNQKSM